jgi:flagellar basal body rod protein FlgB
MTEEVENEDKNNVDYKRENTDYDDDDRRYWMQRKCIMWLLMWYTW